MRSSRGARVALLVDWDSWWAVELSDGPNRAVRYLDVLTAYHRALWQANAAVDVVTADLSGYDVVVAPLLHLVKSDFPDRVTAVVERGGSFLTTVLSGRVDEDDDAFLTDGPFADLLGLRVEETDAQGPDVVNPVAFGGRSHAARHVFELIVAEGGTDVLGTRGADFYAGTPAITRRGNAWYVGTLLDDAGVSAVVRSVLDHHGLAGPPADVPDVEVAERVTPEGERLLFVLNHGATTVTVPCPAAGVDLLGGGDLAAGDDLVLVPTAVVLLRCQ